MTIGVFMAVRDEMAGLLRNMQVERIVKEFIYKGKIKNKPVILIRTGAGINRARKAAESAISLYRPEIIISTGWAGGTKNDINRGEMVIGENIHDSEGRHSVSSDLALCSLAIKVSKQKGIPFHVGDSLTVPRVYFLPEEKKWASDTWSVSMVEMESHGIVSVALQENIPCLMARVISDAAWEKASANSACQSVNDVLDKFLLSFIEAL